MSFPTSNFPNFFVLIATLSFYLASALPVDAVPGPTTDQCGPYPPVPGIADTCQSPLASSPDQPQIWGVSCFPQPSNISVAMDDCLPGRDSICKQISDPTALVKDKWVWFSDHNSKCALAYWSPASHIVNGVTSQPASAPTYDRCMNDIFAPLINDCSSDGKTMQNFAGINLLALPQGNSNGQTVTGGENYWSFVVANKQLTSAFGIVSVQVYGFHWAAASAH